MQHERPHGMMRILENFCMLRKFLHVVQFLHAAHAAKGPENKYNQRCSGVHCPRHRWYKTCICKFLESNFANVLAYLAGLPKVCLQNDHHSWPNLTRHGISDRLPTVDVLIMHKHCTCSLDGAIKGSSPDEPSSGEDLDNHSESRVP